MFEPSSFIVSSQLRRLSKTKQNKKIECVNCVSNTLSFINQNVYLSALLYNGWVGETTSFFFVSFHFVRHVSELSLPSKSSMLLAYLFCMPIIDCKPIMCAIWWALATDEYKPYPQPSISYHLLRENATERLFQSVKPIKVLHDWLVCVHCEPISPRNICAQCYS